MALSKQAYSSVQRVLRNRTFKVVLNKVWREIHNELGVGDLSSRNLTLSLQDHEKMREWFKADVEADPLTTDVTGDRLETSTLVRDEKWATKSVFSGMIKVNIISGAVPLTQGDATTPAGTLLEVDVDDVIVGRINTIVLVENGIVARHWNQCRFPSELSSALMVYRGHGVVGMKSVREWIGLLPSSVLKVGYFDFDPAGMGIAVDYGMDAILIPDPLSEDLVMGINNKPEHHTAQLSHRPDLGTHLPAALHDVWSWMTEENRKCAVTQERLCIMDWSLVMKFFNRAN